MARKPGVRKVSDVVMKVSDGAARCHMMLGWCHKSRSEQAPESVFHPRDESEKNHYDFLGPSCCNMKLDPET